jgi:protein-tyrosine-phosphatase
MSYKIPFLFVCTGNSARSQIAEALLRHTDSQNFEAASAGTNPKPINHKALEVITLCDKAAQECQLLANPAEVLAWNFEDPSASSDPKAFEHTLQAIHERIKLFVLVKTKRN